MTTVEGNSATPHGHSVVRGTFRRVQGHIETTTMRVASEVTVHGIHLLRARHEPGRMEAVKVMRGTARLRQSPWAVASTAYAWCAVVALTVLIVPSTLLIVVPPALITVLPLVVAHRHRPVASLAAAVVLAVWGVVGITLLGSYFLPSAALLAVAYGDSGRKGDRVKGNDEIPRIL